MESRFDGHFRGVHPRKRPPKMAQFVGDGAGRPGATAEAAGDRGARTVYVCHPFSADVVGNGRRVTAIARGLVIKGCLPLAPQIYLPRFVEEDTERDLALRLCLDLLALADEVRVYGEPSEGMRLEIAEASRLGIPIVRGVAHAD